MALLATPDSTFVFVNWTGSSTSTDNPLSVTIDADKSYTANFVKKQYPLTILIEGEGIVSEEIITNGRIEDYDVGTLVQLDQGTNIIIFNSTIGYYFFTHDTFSFNKDC